MPFTVTDLDCVCVECQEVMATIKNGVYIHLTPSDSYIKGDIVQCPSCMTRTIIRIATEADEARNFNIQPVAAVELNR